MFHWFRKHDVQGLERPDPVPIEVPIGLKRPLTLAEQIARFTRDDVIQRELADRGIETFDQSNDFGLEDDGADPHTPYEEGFHGSEIPPQTHLDESRSGMVEEFPAERAERAKKWFKPKVKEAEPTPPKGDVKL